MLYKRLGETPRQLREAVGLAGSFELLANGLDACAQVLVAGANELDEFGQTQGAEQLRAMAEGTVFLAESAYTDSIFCEGKAAYTAARNEFPMGGVGMANKAFEGIWVRGCALDKLETAISAARAAADREVERQSQQRRNGFGGGGNSRYARAGRSISRSPRRRLRSRSRSLERRAAALGVA